MILTEKQNKELEIASRPLIKWIAENCNPHATAIVDYASIELKYGVCRIPVEDYIPD